MAKFFGRFLAGARTRRGGFLLVATLAGVVFGSLPAAAATVAAVSGRRPTAKTDEIRAIYLTGLMAGSEHGKQIAAAWRANQGNAVVFDIKDADGNVSFESGLPLAGHVSHPYIHDLGAWIAWLHAHGLYAIARVAAFKDERLVKTHPELAIHSRSTGRLWSEHGTPAWVDPSLPEVQNYEISLALAAAAAGADEIQFDYIRFPTEGNQKDTVFHYQSSDPTATRADVITDFLYRARQALQPTGVHLSIDVFGVMAWARPVDLAATGQDILALSYFCDVLSPMIYPSHFFRDFDGITDPGDQPDQLITLSLSRFAADTRDTGVVIRPWLQAFAWHAKTFGPQYIRIQVQAARRQGAVGFLLWNAGNKYRPALEAMPAMTAAPATYFLGGFPYPISAAATGHSLPAVGR